VGTGAGLNEPAATASVGIDWVVAGARADSPLDERLEWVEHFATWVRTRSGDTTPATKLRFFLQVLERNEERKRDVAALLRSTFGELSALTLLCETGLPRANALLQEFIRRVASKLLPAPPAAPDFATLFSRVFPDESDASWIATLPASVLDGLSDLLQFGVEDVQQADIWSAMRRDAQDSLLVLASNVQAIGLSGRVRARVASGRIIDTPFANLAATVRDFIETVPDTPECESERAALASHIARCRRGLVDAMEHLESFGVSTDLVFMLERARLSLNRMEPLMAICAGAALHRGRAARFVASLVRANAAQDSVRTLLRENGRLLARRVVESSRKTGEHYLTQDAAEYRTMLWSAAIGGALTGLTVLVKFALTGHGLPLFVEGVLAAINYALSFVAIHFLHGTLATKQPAMTAAAIAAKLQVARHRRRLADFVDQVASLVRSQMAAILGNLAIVVPSALLLQVLLLLLGAGHLPDAAHAPKYIEGLSPLGLAPLYAAFTGVLLWLSAVIAGWFENWATYRRLPEAIAAAPRLIARYGPERAKAIAGGVERNVAALGGNVALGVLLGMAPQIALFFGLPLDVRHVTLSTGQLALASFALGPAVFSTGMFWLAVAGIGVIGFLNLTVSFGLAMWVAIRSTGAGAVSRRRLRRAVLGRLLSRPRDFLLPPRAA
jgi:site-specific recombinase